MPWIKDEDGQPILVAEDSKENKIDEFHAQRDNEIAKNSYNLKNQKTIKMKKAKITHIQGNGTWNDLYKFDVTMDNNDTGTVFSKSQTPTFAVGDEKTYEITPSGRGHKIKWIQEQRAYTPSGNGGGGGYQKSPQDKAEIARAVALKAAVDAIGAGEHPSKYVNVALYFEHYLTTGQQANQDAIDNALSNAKMDANDDLPF